MPYVEDKDLMHRYQADILNERVTDNPLMPYNKRASKNKSLKTSDKSAVGAINELNQRTDQLVNSMNKAMKEQLNFFGNFVENEQLVTDLQKIDVSAIEAIIKIYKELNGEDLDKKIDISEIAPSIKEAIQKLSGKVETANQRVINFQEKFAVPKKTADASFRLSHKAIESTIRFQVNGVEYECAFIPEKNRIEWVFTEENGGFDLGPEYSINIFYDYDPSDDAPPKK